MFKYVVLCCVLILSGCSTTGDSPDWKTPSAELYDARVKFKNSNFQILFLLMVNNRGDVIKSRVLSSKIQDDRAVNMFKKHTRNVRFPTISDTKEQYREIIYPYRVNTIINI
ncbi:hypothetical protein [Psychrobium sp. 1_MG-2023]|uniref:hypothetical protein n=1 Tax=Psychrobium sp. 1_MG-2023 TaxID=3062624 RepID=UPI000C31EF49|nr:hypothetical protein [Psychrobium sp. 1_MG-2023]MDP2560123.1 hypothetical protein [Psychrobium sp. 1_MG-2023]PKF56936.1 hypothetical protein CW748_07520 [Alteromonadales bacterium alter-6D02]